MAASTRIVEKANELYTRYCKPVVASKGEGGMYHRLNRFDPFELIKSFVNEILVVTETEIIDIYKLNLPSRGQ